MGGVADPEGNDPATRPDPRTRQHGPGPGPSGTVDTGGHGLRPVPRSREQLWFLRGGHPAAGRGPEFHRLDGDPVPGAGLPADRGRTPSGTFAITDGSTDAVDTSTGTSDDVGDGRS